MQKDSTAKVKADVTKKEAVEKTTAGTTETTAKEQVSEEKPVKTEKPAAEKTDSKEPEKKAAEKTDSKESEKKAAEKSQVKPPAKAAAKKPGRTAKKATAKKAAAEQELLPEVYIQFDGQEVLEKDLLERAREDYIADGHRASSIHKMQVYVKPQDGYAYYVVNEKYLGKVELFTID